MMNSVMINDDVRECQKTCQNCSRRSHIVSALTEVDSVSFLRTRTIFWFIVAACSQHQHRHYIYRAIYVMRHNRRHYSDQATNNTVNRPPSQTESSAPGSLSATDLFYTQIRDYSQSHNSKTYRQRSPPTRRARKDGGSFDQAN